MIFNSVIVILYVIIFNTILFKCVFMKRMALKIDVNYYCRSNNSVTNKQIEIPGISCGQKSSQAGHRGSALPLKYLATHGLCIFMPHTGFSQI